MLVKKRLWKDGSNTESVSSLLTTPWQVLTD
jgi:hypothetical protein